MTAEDLRQEILQRERISQFTTALLAGHGAPAAHFSLGDRVDDSEATGKRGTGAALRTMVHPLSTPPVFTGDWFSRVAAEEATTAEGTEAHTTDSSTTENQSEVEENASRPKFRRPKSARQPAPEVRNGSDDRTNHVLSMSEAYQGMVAAGLVKPISTPEVSNDVPAKHEDSATPTDAPSSGPSSSADSATSSSASHAKVEADSESEESLVVHLPKQKKSDTDDVSLTLQLPSPSSEERAKTTPLRRSTSPPEELSPARIRQSGRKRKAPSHAEESEEESDSHHRSEESDSSSPLVFVLPSGESRTSDRGRSRSKSKRRRKRT